MPRLRNVAGARRSAERDVSHRSISLAGQHFNVQPDMVVLAKALSGGLIPVGAVLMREEIFQAVYSTLRRAIVHTSTFSENALAMRAGLATLDVLELEKLGARSAQLGARLRQLLNQTLQPYEMFAGTRGLGLLSGIEFRSPEGLSLRSSKGMAFLPAKSGPKPSLQKGLSISDRAPQVRP